MSSYQILAITSRPITTTPCMYGFPLTCRYFIHAYTERVVTSVTLVTEHHLILVMRLAAHGAGLTLHALPAVRLDYTHQLLAHVQAGWMACSLWTNGHVCRTKRAQGQTRTQTGQWEEKTNTEKQKKGKM